MVCSRYCHPELAPLRRRSRSGFMSGSFAQDDNLPWLFAGSQRLSLRRIRDSDARNGKRILRLRSQARFAQDDISLRRIRDSDARNGKRILRLRSQARFAQDDISLRRIRDSDARNGKRILRWCLPQDDTYLSREGFAECLSDYGPALADDEGQAFAVAGDGQAGGVAGLAAGGNLLEV